MAFEQTYPLFAAGPRADLSIFYGKFTASSSGAVFTASADTSQGLTMTGSGGTNVLNHPKCRMAIFTIEVKIPTLATIADKREVTKKAVDDPTTGILNFNTANEAAPPVVAAVVDGSVIEVWGLAGF